MSAIMSILQFIPTGTQLPVALFEKYSGPILVAEGILSTSRITLLERSSPEVENTNTDAPEYQFGVLEISTPEKDALPYTWDVKFDVDCSGSMSDHCMDGRTKMQHIKHVLTNILRLFASYGNMTFNVSIDAFDDRISNIFDFVQITPSNVEEHIAKINGIHPRGQTNLVLPLQKTSKQIAERASAFPSNKRLHFLLTDGNDTFGNSSKTIVNAAEPQYDTIVFGFGQDHDSKTLMAIGDKPFCEYAFIAELEKAGIVYGEYIHNVLYRCIEGMAIIMSDAEIYCWKTNSWSPSLVIGNLASDMKKTYYVRTTKPVETVCGEIHGRECLLDDDGEFGKLGNFDPMPHLIDENGEIDTKGFKDHSLRFKTLELLYQVAHLEDDEVVIEESQDIFSTNWFTPKKSEKSEKSEKYNNKVKELKEKLLTLYRQIRDYKVATYGDDANTFLAALMDDLYIARRSFDHNNGRLYTMARQRTQGTQNVYTPSNIDDLLTSPVSHSQWPTTTPMRGFSDLGDNDLLTNIAIPDFMSNSHNTPRAPRFGINPVASSLLHQDETDILSHNISCGTQDDYASPRMLDIIRSTSDTAGEDDSIVIDLL